MKTQHLRPSRFLLLSLLGALAYAAAIGPAAAVSISGSVQSQSQWQNLVFTNASGTTAFGDGSGTAALIVGLWNADAEVSGTPFTSQTLVAFGAACPISGSSYPYTLGGALPNGSYNVVAFIDGDNDGGYDEGEPRSVTATATIADGKVVLGFNITCVDDSDEDDLPDYWEVHWFDDLDESGSTDYDKDGLSNLAEYNISKNIAQLRMLNPANFDTDGDAMDDDWEYDHWANGTGTHACTNDAAADWDGDGLPNLQEYGGMDGKGPLEQDPGEATGIARNTGSTDDLNPIDLDTDGDTLIDSFEAGWFKQAAGIDPKSAGDPAADWDVDGLTHYREQCLLVELREGGTNDIWLGGAVTLPAMDANGLRAFVPPLDMGVAAGSVSNAMVQLQDEEWTDPGDPDSDTDLLPDGWELEYNLNPRVATGNDGYFGDPDGDTLINYQEFHGQDGNRAATNEHINGTGDETNPNQHNWRPNSTFEGIGLLRGNMYYVGTNHWFRGVSDPTNTTLGAALPTISLGFDWGTDTDDDGTGDNTELQQEFEGVGIGSSPVHSMHPFIRRCARISDAGGIPLPDPDGSPTGGYRPLIHARDWTMECYVKIMAAGKSGYLINIPGPIDEPTISHTCRLSLSNDVPEISFYTQGEYRYSVRGPAIPTDRWVHIAGVWDHAANSLSLYLDGVFVQEQRVYEEALSYVRYTCLTPPTIGESPDTSFVNDVYVDEVRIWGVARTPGQIEEYRRRLVPQESVGLIAYFRFDDGGVGAEDFARKARSGLVGGVTNAYFYGDFGYALTNGFTFDTNVYADVIGVDKRGADDSDGDMMPDGWEMVNHLDPLSASAVDGADGDPDGDGLKNVYEFWARTNPNAEDTDQDGILDGQEDLDEDGIINTVEQTLGSRPDMVDTDDDGLADSEESASGTSPKDPAAPSRAQCLQFGGAATDYVEVPNSLFQRLTSWTLETWIFAASEDAGTLVRRVVQNLDGGTNAVNYEMGVLNDGTLKAYAGYVLADANATTFRVTSGTLETGKWTHIAASYDAPGSTLTLYTNGVESVSLAGASPAGPMNGRGGETFLRIGEDFEGFVDDVRLWKVVRTEAEVRDNMESALDGPNEANLVNYFTFDDGQAVTNATFPAFDAEFHWPYGPQDFCYTQDWLLQWQHAGTIAGNVEFVLQGAVAPPATLQVYLQPSEARALGAQWTIQGLGEWKNSGEQIQRTETDGLGVTVICKSITDWITPADVAVTLVSGETTVLTNTYLQTGALQVFIQPPEAIEDGALWSINGADWYDSGTVLSNISAGTQTVQFREITGWTAPAAAPVTIQGGKVTYYYGTYTLDTGSPSLRVTLLPAAVVSAGAQWRLGTNSWMNSGALLAGLSAGTTYSIEFKDINNWITPSTITTSFTGSATVDLSATYHEAYILGGEGTTPGRFKEPRGLVVDGTRHVYVADSGNHRIQILNPVNNTWGVLGSYGSGNGQFNQPFDVALDSQGYLWVADANNHRIQKLTGTGGFVQAWGRQGSAVGLFNGPVGIAIDSMDNVYVADRYNHRVQKLTAATGSWSVFVSNGFTNGFVRAPAGVTVDDADSVYVTDADPGSLVSRVQKFDSNGLFISLLASSAVNEGMLTFPTDLHMGSGTNLYVADTGANRVMQMSRTESWSEFLGTGTLVGPAGVTEDPFGNLYVSDTENHRIIRFGSVGPGVVPGGPAPNDFDGDGLSDFWKYDQPNGTWYLLTTTLGYAQTAFGWAAAAPIHADYDGDGKTDVAVFGPGGMWYILGSAAGFYTRTFGWTGPTPVPADYDGDGKADIALYNQPSGTWYIRKSIDSSIQVRQFGWGAASPVQADYDGDNKADIAVFASGTWYILGSAAGFYTRAFGWSGPTPVAADYDGDGKDDIALYNQPSGTWYILNSGSSSVRVQQFGWSGASPVQADYDGDAKIDIAVLGPNGMWYIMGSAAGFWTQHFGW
ncbi:MAG: VCBS repeat-containing protein [Kiritimatiellae bacterium]|nr:VCBS repeat-containing protein [Kiritimatiellia bacterium]